MDTPITFRSAGTAPDSCHAINRGTSALQWGHQCARKTNMYGLPSPGVTVTGEPSKLDPVNVGALDPTAGSGPSSGRRSSAEPSTCTGWFSALAPDGVSSLGESPPASTAINKATTIATTTPMITQRPLFDAFFFDCCFAMRASSYQSSDAASRFPDDGFTNKSATIATNPHSAMKASVTNPMRRNHTSVHDGPTEHAPSPQLGRHSMT